MKKKDFYKQLAFNKRTVSNLNSNEQAGINGGGSVLEFTIGLSSAVCSQVVMDVSIAVSNAVSEFFSEVGDAIADWDANNTIQYKPPATQGYNRTCIV